MSRKPSRSNDRLSNELAVLDHRLGPIEYRPLASLKRHESNPRKHPEKQLVKLAASIREFGFAMPILVDEADTIIVGEARLDAARRVGMAEVPVIVAHYWSAAQIRAYRLADNKLADLATWDEDLLAIELAAILEFDEVPVEALGWDTEEIHIILEDENDQPEESAVNPADEYLEPPKIPVSREGDLWLLGKHRLICGSCLEAANWQRLLEGEKAAMAFTDPPYNIPVTGHVCGLGKVSHAEFAMASGEMCKAEFTAFLSSFISAMLPHCKDGAVLDFCMDWRHMGEMLSAIEGNGLSLLDLCAWNKNSGGMGSLYRSKHELVFIAKKGEAPHTNNVELGRHGRYRTNVWDYAGINTSGKSRMQDLADHPTVKPTALVADAIRDVTHSGEIVIDAFMGSGTTILACEQTMRRGFGIESEPGYVDVAIRRWETMTGDQAILAETGQPMSAVAEARSANPTEHDKGSRSPGETPQG